MQLGMEERASTELMVTVPTMSRRTFQNQITTSDPCMTPIYVLLKRVYVLPDGQARQIG